MNGQPDPEKKLPSFDFPTASSVTALMGAQDKAVFTAPKIELPPPPQSKLRRAWNAVKGFAAAYKKPLVWAGSAAMAEGSAVVNPDLALPALVVLGTVTAYLMHKTSDFAMADLERYGAKKKISPLSLGILAGMIHTANEALVSLMALRQGSPDLAIANIVGGSITHTMLVLGASAAIAGIGKGAGLGWKFNTGVFVGATGIFGAQLLAGEFSAPAGAAMAATGLYYLWQRTRGGEACADDQDHNGDEPHFHLHGGMVCAHDHDRSATPAEEKRAAWKDGLSGVASLGALIAVSDVLVKQILRTADENGISHTAMGLTIAALATTMPEMIMTVKAAIRKKSEFALGNVMGCNITNTLVVGGMVAGLGAVTGQVAQVPDALKIDSLEGAVNMGMFLGGTALATLALVAQKGEIRRWQGAAAVVLYLGYLASMPMISGGHALIHTHEHPSSIPSNIDSALPTFQID
jgi:cation:H+ antiporter